MGRSPMTRRIDYLTAELVDIVLLARDALGHAGASNYVDIAGLEPWFFVNILEREAADVRKRRLCDYATDPDERRRLPRRAIN
jgi:hypothetical protein